MAILPRMNMGIINPSLAFKRQFRYLFLIDNICGYGSSIFVKQPSKSQRPNIAFKEESFEHVSETIYMPGKVEWKPITLTLYDTYVPGYKEQNPVYLWIRQFYSPEELGGTYGFAGQNGFKKTAFLNGYDGSGCLIESWEFQNAWCQDVNFNEVDMAGTEVLTIDITLRYDRARLLSN